MTMPQVRLVHEAGSFRLFISHFDTGVFGKRANNLVQERYWKNRQPQKVAGKGLGKVVGSWDACQTYRFPDSPTAEEPWTNPYSFWLASSSSPSVLRLIKVNLFHERLLDSNLIFSLAFTKLLPSPTYDS